MMFTRMKPCPWCSNTAVWVEMDEHGGFAAGCTVCKAQGPRVDSKRGYDYEEKCLDAAAKWDARGEVAP